MATEFELVREMHGPMPEMLREQERVAMPHGTSVDECGYRDLAKVDEFGPPVEQREIVGLRELLQKPCPDCGGHYHFNVGGELIWIHP